MIGSVSEILRMEKRKKTIWSGLENETVGLGGGLEETVSGRRKGLLVCFEIGRGPKKWTVSAHICFFDPKTPFL